MLHKQCNRATLGPLAHYRYRNELLRPIFERKSQDTERLRIRKRISKEIWKGEPREEVWWRSAQLIRGSILATSV